MKRGVGMCGIGSYMVTLSCEAGPAPASTAAPANTTAAPANTTATPGSTSAPAPSGETSGEIQSPDHPDRYPHNQNQTWDIEVASGQTIELTFESFDIEDCGWANCNCAYDYVLVSFD